MRRPPLSPLPSRRRGHPHLRFSARHRPRPFSWGLTVVAVVALTSLAGHAGGDTAASTASASDAVRAEEPPPTSTRTVDGVLRVLQAEVATPERPRGTPKLDARELDARKLDARELEAPELEAPERGIPELPGSTDLAEGPLLGTLSGLDVHLPTADPVVVGFHEAASSSARSLRPVGQLAGDENTTRTDLPPDASDGLPYLVLSSRGRVAGPTSAVDVVMRDDDPVLASVTGTVVDVRGYLLYGAHRDVRIEIVPDARPDLRVVVIHVSDATVSVGDTVVGGVTPLASSVRRFPFASQIDRETEPERFGHVHLEVQPVAAPRPGDDDPPDDATDG